MQIDKEILSGISKGDEKTIFQLYRLCYDDLYMVCRRYVSNEDEIGGLLNSAFLKIVKNIKTYNLSIPFEAWIRRIMINTSIDYYRKNKKYRDVISYPSEEQTIENNNLAVDYNVADQQFDVDQLLSMIDMLPAATKTVFNLYAIDGYSHREIGDMLNMSEGTSKWHLSTARKRLQSMLVFEMNKNLVNVNSGDR